MSDFNHNTQTQINTGVELELDEPGWYKVVLFNDDFTTMEFVVYILERIFRKKPAEATRIMLEVHQKGSGVCGVYTYEIAETKVAHVEKLAFKEGFPLKCTMETA